MTLQTRPAIARPISGDNKPTQVNEHKRGEEMRASEHEPHAMARQRGVRAKRGSAQ